MKKLKKKAKNNKAKELGRIDATLPMMVRSVPAEGLEGIATKGAPTQELAYGQVDVCVTNSGMDRHGESITMKGIDTTQFMRNPVVLWAHDYMGLPIGKVIKMWNEGDNKMARIQYAVQEDEFSNTVYKMVLGGYINAVSIGGLVSKWSKDQTNVDEMEMLEISTVPIGAHPDALVIGKALHMERGEIEKQFNTFVKNATIDKLKVIPQNDITVILQALESLVAILKGTVKPVEPIEAGVAEIKRKIVFKFKK